MKAIETLKSWLEISECTLSNTYIGTKPEIRVVKEMLSELENFEAGNDSDKTCETCSHWSERKKNNSEVDARLCDLEPFDIRSMKDDHFAIICGHDGGVFCGPKFGCIHWNR